jgi:hypothetical protein
MHESSLSQLSFLSKLPKLKLASVWCDQELAKLLIRNYGERIRFSFKNMEHNF